MLGRDGGMRNARKRSFARTPDSPHDFRLGNTRRRPRKDRVQIKLHHGSLWGSRPAFPLVVVGCSVTTHATETAPRTSMRHSVKRLAHRTIVDHAGRVLCCCGAAACVRSAAAVRNPCVCLRPSKKVQRGLMGWGGKLEKFSAETFPRAIRLCHTQQGLCDWVALTSSSRSSSTSARMPVLSGARGGRLLAGTAVGRAPSRRVGRGDVRSRRRKVRLRVQPMGRRFRERTMTTNGRTLTTCAMRDPRNR